MKCIVVTFVVEREGKHYVARSPELGTASFGDTEDEAFHNIAEATAEYLNALEELGERSLVLQKRAITVHEVVPGSVPDSVPVVCPPGSTVHSSVFPLEQQATYA